MRDDGVVRRSGSGAFADADVSPLDQGPVSAEDGGALNHVHELAHIAGPADGRAGPRAHSGVSCLREPTLREAIEEELGESGHIVHALLRVPESPPGRRRGDDRDRGGRHPPRSALLKRLMSSGDDPNVDVRDCVFADALDLAALEEAQHLGLKGEGHLADFVEEEGSTVSGFDAADARLRGAGEGTASVTEELGLEKGLGDGGAVEDGHDLVAAGAEGVDGSGDELLAGPGRALDENGGVARALRDG